MTDQQKLNDYTFRQLQSGLSPDEITQQLRGAGWNETLIAGAFEAARATLTPATQPVSETATNTSAAPAVSFAPIGQKRGRIKTGWLLLKQSLKVLQNNKQLVRYPFMATLIGLAILIAFVAILLTTGDTFIVYGIDREYYMTWYGAGLSVVYYILTFFVVFLYNAGLAAHALDIFRGKSLPYAHYMAIAWSKRGPIFVYSLISVTVGLILRFIEQRAQWLGYIVSRILGAVWTLANLFTIPIIVESDSNAPSAIKQSTQLFLSRWGENITARITFSGITALIMLLVLTPITILLAVLTSALGGFGFILSAVIFVVSLIILITIQNAAESILSTALYFFAKYQQIPGVYDPTLLNAVFIPKKPKK